MVRDPDYYRERGMGADEEWIQTQMLYALAEASERQADALEAIAAEMGVEG